MYILYVFIYILYIFFISIFLLLCHCIMFPSTLHATYPSVRLDLRLFTADICVALRHPDGFTLPYNLVRETILWEMSALSDYEPLLSV